MNPTTRTKALLSEALESPTLAPPGGCQYVDDKGCRCNVGTVLHLTGVSDKKLRGEWSNSNDKKISARTDLRLLARKADLDLELLQVAQGHWDKRDQHAARTGIVEMVTA